MAGQTHNNAAVEYLGQYPSTVSVHGNCKRTKSNFVRTTEAARDQVENAVQMGNKPREIYEDMVLNDSVNAPRTSSKFRIASGKWTKKAAKLRSIEVIQQTTFRH